MHADDVAQAFQLALERPDAATGHAFHVVAERALALRGFAEAVAGWFGAEPDLAFLPFDEWRSTTTPEHADTSFEHVARSHVMSIDAARTRLGYAPAFSALDAVREAVTHLADTGRIRVPAFRGGEAAGMTGVAIVGTGRMAAAHAKAWRTLAPEAEVVAVVSERMARPLEDAPGARATTDLDAVLADPAVEALSICTPTDSHLRLALRALDAGKHVLLEKPLASSVEEGEALRRRAAEGPGIVMVAHVVRFFPGYAAVRDLVRRGDLGEVTEARAVRLTSDPDRPAWLRDEARSGGLLVDLAVHDFDQLLLLLGPAVRVTAVPVAEGVEAVVEHAAAAAERCGWAGTSRPTGPSRPISRCRAAAAGRTTRSAPGRRRAASSGSSRAPPHP